MTNIQWYPGHMEKARRQMEEELKLVDIIIEIRDARFPNGSSNPVLGKLANNKPRLIILNKADLANQEENRKWKETLEKDNRCLLVNSTHDNLAKTVVDEVKDILKAKLERAKARGIRKKSLRAMVVGIPNVGKSTFINNIVKKKIAKTENRPGVTRNLQWIRLNDDVELLDTPGVLWPKFDDENTAILLALLGSINDDILDKEALVNYGLNYLKREYPGVLNRRYGIDESKDNLLEEIAAEKKWLSSSGVINRDKAYDAILKDIRNNEIKNITWEKIDA